MAPHTSYDLGPFNVRYVLRPDDEEYFNQYKSDHPVSSTVAPAGAMGVDVEQDQPAPDAPSFHLKPRLRAKPNNPFPYVKTGFMDSEDFKYDIRTDHGEHTQRLLGFQDVDGQSLTGDMSDVPPPYVFDWWRDNLSYVDDSLEQMSKSIQTVNQETDPTNNSEVTDLDMFRFENLAAVTREWTKLLGTMTSYVENQAPGAASRLSDLNSYLVASAEMLNMLRERAYSVHSQMTRSVAGQPYIAKLHSLLTEAGDADLTFRQKAADYRQRTVASVEDRKANLALIRAENAIQSSAKSTLAAEKKALEQLQSEGSSEEPNSLGILTICKKNKPRKKKQNTKPQNEQDQGEVDLFKFDPTPDGYNASSTLSQDLESADSRGDLEPDPTVDDHFPFNPFVRSQTFG